MKSRKRMKIKVEIGGNSDEEKCKIQPVSPKKTCFCHFSLATGPVLNAKSLNTVDSPQALSGSQSETSGAKEKTSAKEPCCMLSIHSDLPMR